MGRGKNGGGFPASGSEAPAGCHKVTSEESVAGYAVFTRDIGDAKLLEIQSIAGINTTTAQKFITLGYVTPKGGYVPLKSGQQANDVDQYVTIDHRVKARAVKVYMRIEDPALADVICLSFAVAEEEP